MKEEVRRIVYYAVAAPDQISHIFQKYFGEKNGVNLDTLEQRKPHEPMDFNDSNYNHSKYS